MTKGEKAREIFKEGYSCAQSVLMAYSEDFGMTEKDAARVMCALGGGIARSRETCGAVIGALAVIGLKYSDGSSGDKMACYEKGQAFMKEFAEENGSVICRELLDPSLIRKNGTVPDDRNEEYYKKRPCADIVEYAADLIEKYI